MDLLEVQRQMGFAEALAAQAEADGDTVLAQHAMTVFMALDDELERQVVESLPPGPDPRAVPI